jgi:outer membrane protein assembly factor BamB
MRLGLFAALAAALPALAADTNWPAFRGPTGDGHADAAKIPTEWSETQNVLWKTPVHGKGWSSPVVWGNQIWVTTADEEGGAKGGATTKTAGFKHEVQRVTLFAVCVDKASGKVVHDLKLGVQEKPQFCHPFNSNASPTPTVEEGRVYAHFGSLGTWCVDTASGKVLWERRDLPCNHFRGPGSSPVIFENLLILIQDGADQQYVVALDKTSGKTVWKKDRNIPYVGLRPNDDGDTKKAYATPQVFEVNGKPVMVCPSAHQTIAYDPRTGDEVWRLTHDTRPSMNAGNRTVGGHGLLFIQSGHSGQLLAVKADVKGAVTKDAAVWTLGKDVSVRPSLLLVGDYLYMVTDTGNASCVDAKTGKVMWKEKLGASEFSASPLYANGNIYFCDQVGTTFVVAANPKEFTLVAENRLAGGYEGGFMASPAVTGDTLLLRTRTHLYAIGKK